jgi:hypothetical protein
MGRWQFIALATALACGASSAQSAAAAPIESESSGARAFVTSLILRDEVQSLEHQFSYTSRDLIDRALRQFAAATDYATLAASSDGVSLPCPVSGTVTARVSNAWLRVVRLEWQQCVPDQSAFINTFDGPAEVTLLASLFTAARCGP